jgi:flagellar capping protein FliD
MNEVMKEQRKTNKQDLYRQITLLEEAMSKLQSQRMFLTSALASLSSMSPSGYNPGGLL